MGGILMKGEMYEVFDKEWSGIKRSVRDWTIEFSRKGHEAIENSKTKEEVSIFNRSQRSTMEEKENRKGRRTRAPSRSTPHTRRE
jgi:hypothetical protein